MKHFYKATIFVAAVIVYSTLLLAATLANKSLPKKGDAAKSYQIENKKFGDLLRPQDANGGDGTAIVLYPAQPWKCMTWKLTPADDSGFTVRNHFTGKTFTAVNGKGKHVTQIPLARDLAKAVQWRFVKLADGTYRIADPKSGNVLTAVKDDSSGEVRIDLLPWQDRDEQKWDLQEIDPAKLTM
jgi:hypothetical protein